VLCLFDESAEGWNWLPIFSLGGRIHQPLGDRSSKRKAAGMQSDEVTESLLEKNVDLGNGDATAVEVEHATAVEVELRTLINIGYDIAGLLKCILCMCLIIVVVQLLLVFVQMKK